MKHLVERGILVFMKPNEDKKAFFTRNGAAHYCSVSVRTVGRWLQYGLPYIQATPGGRVLIRIEDLNHFLNAKSVKRTQPFDRMAEKTLREENPCRITS